MLKTGPAPWCMETGGCTQRCVHAATFSQLPLSCLHPCPRVPVLSSDLTPASACQRRVPERAGGWDQPRGVR